MADDPAGWRRLGAAVAGGRDWMSRAELARRAGCSVTTIGILERGDRRVGVQVLRDVEDALG